MVNINGREIAGIVRSQKRGEFNKYEIGRISKEDWEFLISGILDLSINPEWFTRGSWSRLFRRLPECE